MKIHLLLVICTLFQSTLIAQNLKLLYDENFNNNLLQWNLSENEEAASEIINGYFFLKNKTTNYAYRFGNTLKIEQTENFEIQSKLRQVFGNEDDAFGIIILSQNDKNNINFEIKSTGYYRISIQKNGYYDNIKWTKTPAIKTNGEYNILKVKNINNYLYYYINGKLVKKEKFNNTFGNYFGFILRNKMKIQIDYLKIYGSNLKINLVENPISNQKENLGPAINTTTTELIPIISHDGQYLYFARNNYHKNTTDSYNDIWVSKFNGNEWTIAKNIGRPLNNDGHNFIVAVTPDNNTLVLNGTYTAFGESASNGLSVSTKNNDGSWSIPRTIKIDNFYNENKYQNFTVSADLQVIIMSIERKDTYGDNDLYISFRKSNGTYSEPENLGNIINTSSEEGTPFLAADAKTLYFFSKGHNGYGNGDIFVAKRNSDSWTDWSTPLNLGKNINTPGWDAYFTIDAKGEYAYFVSSDTIENKEDIYRIKIDTELQPEPVVLIYGKVLDKKNNTPINAKILYNDLTKNTQIDLANSNAKTGEYKIILQYGKKYGFFAKKYGYLALSANIDLTNIDKYTEIERNLYLVPIEINQKIPLNNVFFKSGETTIQTNSYAELDRLVQTLKTNKNMKIKIQGYTNNIGKKQELIELSEQRAEAVKKYITNKGINENKILTEGLGSKNPIADNNTLEGRKKNQRVEFIILEK